ARIASRAATPLIDWLFVVIVWRTRGLRQFLARTGARINEAVIPQLAPCLEIVRAPLTLRVRVVGTTAVCTFAPLNTEPVQVFEHSAGKLRPGAVRIQIFIAKDQSAAVLSRALRRDEECAGVPGMEQPCG